MEVKMIQNVTGNLAGVQIISHSCCCCCRVSTFRGWVLASQSTTRTFPIRLM